MGLFDIFKPGQLVETGPDDPNPRHIFNVKDGEDGYLEVAPLIGGNPADKRDAYRIHRETIQREHLKPGEYED